jgi:hypothetical protein
MEDRDPTWTGQHNRRQKSKDMSMIGAGFEPEIPEIKRSIDSAGNLNNISLNCTKNLDFTTENSVTLRSVTFTMFTPRSDCIKSSVPAN